MNEEDERRNLRARARFKETMDLHEAHMSLQKNGWPIDIKSKPPSTQVWKYMAKIMLAKSGSSEWRNRKSGMVEEYIRRQLGRSDGHTFLTELSPIPAHRTADGPWAERFRERDSNLDNKIERRKKKLQKARKKHDPLVVCYGFGRNGTRKRDFAELLHIEWNQQSDKIYTSDDARCLLLPFFGNGQMCHKVIEDLLDLKLLRPS